MTPEERILKAIDVAEIRSRLKRRSGMGYELRVDMRDAGAEAIRAAVEAERARIIGLAKGYICEAAWKKSEENPFLVERDSIIDGSAMIELIRDIEKRSDRIPE